MVAGTTDLRFVCSAYFVCAVMSPNAEALSSVQSLNLALICNHDAKVAARLWNFQHNKTKAKKSRPPMWGDEYKDSFKLLSIFLGRCMARFWREPVVVKSETSLSTGVILTVRTGSLPMTVKSKALQGTALMWQSPPPPKDSSTLFLPVCFQLQKWTPLCTKLSPSIFKAPLS